MATLITMPFTATTAFTTGATTLNVNKPSVGGTVAAGDIVIIGVAGHITTDTFSVSGFTKIVANTLTGGATYLFWKVAGAAEPSTYAVATSSSCGYAVVCTVVRGASTANTINGTNLTGSVVTATTYTELAITTTVDGCMYIAVNGMALATAGITATGPLVLDGNVANGGASGTRAEVSICHAPLSAAGSSGTFTANSASGSWTGPVFAAIAPLELPPAGINIRQAVNRSGTY